MPGAGPRGPLTNPARPLLGEAAANVEDAGAGQTHLRGDGLICEAALAQADHLPATFLLRGCWQLAHVDMFHPAELVRRPRISRSPKPDQ